MDFIAHFLNPLLMILMPLGLGVVLARRLKVSWGLFFIGAAAFIGSQILHIPFNSWVLGPALQSLEGTLPEQALAVVAALALGLSAGLFEEPARYLAFRSRAPRDRTWSNAIMIGAGHGGVESIILGALVFYGFFQAVALLGADLTALGIQDQQALVESQLAKYWSTPWYLTSLGALERASAITVQIALTVIVLQSFLRRSWLWLGLAIGAHTLVNATALLALPRWGPYWTEAALIGMALVGLYLIFKLRPAEPPFPSEPAEDIQPPQYDLEPAEMRPDQLEDSRYV
jgi:uncharacterized membrane protein YhfC